MLLVPTYVGRSTIHGFGVFTAVPIAGGTLIWEFTPDVDLRLPPEDLDLLPDALQSKMRSYCYREPSGLYVLCGDNAKFMNHSVDPSCDDSGEYTRAKRALRPGDELTCDYRLFDVDSQGKTELEFQASIQGPRRGPRAI